MVYILKLQMVIFSEVIIKGTLFRKCFRGGLMNKLQEKIESTILKAGGEWGIIIEDLNDKTKKIVINDTELFAAQSIIKVPIMAAVFAAYENKKLNLNDLKKLRKEDIVGGTGILKDMSVGLEITVYDLVTLMIIQSDNTATNILIDLVGFDEIKNMMEYGGMEKSCFRKKLMIYPATNTDVENYITAADIHVFYKKIATGKIVSRYSSEKMIHILKKQQIRNALPFYLPENDNNIIGEGSKWELGNKTGTGHRIQHDVGILYVQNQSLLITVLSKNLLAVKSLHTIAHIGKEVYNYLEN